MPRTHDEHSRFISTRTIHKQQSTREKPVATFFGKVVKDGDKFVLSDEKRKVCYGLDDQQTQASSMGRR